MASGRLLRVRVVRRKKHFSVLFSPAWRMEAGNSGPDISRVNCGIDEEGGCQKLLKVVLF